VWDLTPRAQHDLETVAADSNAEAQVKELNRVYLTQINALHVQTSVWKS